MECNPRATGHVPQMIDLVRRLEEGGFTYEKEGSVYFAIDPVPRVRRAGEHRPGGPAGRWARRG